MRSILIQTASQSCEKSQTKVSKGRRRSPLSMSCRYTFPTPYSLEEHIGDLSFDEHTERFYKTRSHLFIGVDS